MIDLCFLWHMHQPRYVDPETGRPVLPWVRLHAASGYLDMARALERAPWVKATVNFVPSLVEQLEELAAGTRDELEELAERPTDTLDEHERGVVTHLSFSVVRKAIDARPRFRELAAMVYERFSVQDLRDLQCLFALGWLGFAAREDAPELAELERKGRNFSEEDKARILGVLRGAACRVLGSFRRLAERGQVELASSPFYHPILPLLVDSDAARRACPHDPMPARFSHPEDAREQIARAIRLHERVFGEKPRGMWPPEGSVSPEVARLYAEAGVGWLAADEGILEHSLSASEGRHVPYDEVRAARGKVHEHGGVRFVFRDRDLSDRIGFRYQHDRGEDAAADFLHAARHSLPEGAREGGIVGVFLDGENAWEHYEGRAEPFFRALYERLEKAPDLRTRTLSEAVRAREASPLPALHTGSWIASNYRIWIGERLKNRGWDLLGRARARLAEVASRRGADDAGVKAARDHLLVAEGSDWFWWLGDPNNSREDALYDDLFRRTLAMAYRALGDEPPAELGTPIHAF